jgi:hypothetical protein
VTRTKESAPQGAPHHESSAISGDRIAAGDGAERDTRFLELRA